MNQISKRRALLLTSIVIVLLLIVILVRSDSGQAYARNSWDIRL